MFRLAVFAALCGGANAGWQLEQRNIATIALGISCPDDTTCFIGATQDGTGNVIFKTTNGGETYERARMDPEGSQMMFLSTAAHNSQSAATAGMGFGSNVQYTSDGNAFYNSEPFTIIGQTQNMKAVPGTRSFGMVGSFGDGNGVAYSTDGGETFEVSAIPNGLIGASGRYAHYIDDNTWYVAGGSWTTNETKTGQITERLSFHQEKSGKVSVKYVKPSNTTKATKNDPRFRAGIGKTTDGGATWENKFFAQDGYYFNQIECPTEESCFVTAEGGGNVRIMASHDAGATWDTVWQPSEGQYELMGLEFLSEREGWACGMSIQPPFEFRTLFLHTIDGGVTWEEDTSLEGFFCTDLSFHNQNFAHAVALDPMSGTSATLVYRA